MKSLIHNSLKKDNSVRTALFKNISIYATGHISDPIHNIETLSLFAKIDKAFDDDNKSLVVECVSNFVKNSDQQYNSEYGKAKDQLEILLKFKNKSAISKCRVTTYDIFTGFGVSELKMQKLGINKTSKTDSVTKIFEYLTSEVLKEKYPYVLDVIVCAPGKLKVSDYVYNGTRQPYFDMLVVIEDSHGNILHLGFDHKVKEFESCIKDIQHHGFKYSIFTLGDVEDRVFYESPAVTEQLKNHNYSQVYNDDAINSNIASKIALSETGSVIATKNLNNNNELVKKVVENITEFERTKDVNVMIRTPLIPVMLCNSKDLAKVVAELNAKRKTPGFGVDFSDVDNYN